MIHPQDDYYGWTQETLEKLRHGRWSEVNVMELIEELEEMGGSERNELENRLVVLLAHLLKWQSQPECRSRSWRLTLKEQRLAIATRIKRSPSLKPRLAELGEDAYPRAVIVAARETDRDEEAFPATFAEIGWTWEQVLDVGFVPD